MLTVKFSLPDDNGGDTISKYLVVWDIAPRFDSKSTIPHKGSVEVDAATYSSYTIRYLTKGQRYYVKVSAINSAGPGTAALSFPISAIPALAIPGRPQSVVASIGALKGEIDVSFQYPTVPWHGIPCFGTDADVFECPKPSGGGLPESTGGLPIIEYEISYSEQSNFQNDYDKGSVVTTNTRYTLSNLTPDRLYYIRVLARNANGPGPFCYNLGTNCNDDTLDQVTALAKPAA